VSEGLRSCDVPESPPARRGPASSRRRGRAAPRGGWPRAPAPPARAAG
jgi:hypothetical protein